MILLSHPTGNANVRAAAQAFVAAEMLAALHTSVHWDPTSLIARLMPDGLSRQLKRRCFDGVPTGLIRAHPWRELGRLGASQLHLHWLQTAEGAPFSIDSVYHSLDRHVAHSLSATPWLQGVYAYEDAALQTFRQAGSLGMARLYDLPIGYWRAGQSIYTEEAVRQPEWASTLGGLRDSQCKLARKDEELEAASAVIVASSYVRGTLQEHGFTDRPVFVIPYGSYPPASKAKPIPGQGPLRVLFVGSLGQRKGLSYLLDAISLLGSAVSLTLIGQRTSDSCTPLDEALVRHRWIPSLPHSEILAEMRAHDVLVFPSLFEGFGLVLTEALSQGIPVIATPHTAAPDLISDGVEGFLVPIRDSGAIAERLQQLSDDRDLLAQMSAAALSLAGKRSWDVYKHQLVATVRSML